uniref:Ribosomal protein L34 n=1 Tax=Polysiphonia sertularioides TaxID=945028 RepID=A0A1Z1MFL3_9FLOR|nr:ribosomal protein L34 [Polysiphonia sertularioides]
MKTVSKLKRKRKNGFLVRMRSASGRRVIRLRRRKKRRSLIN